MGVSRGRKRAINTPPEKALPSSSTPSAVLRDLSSWALLFALALIAYLPALRGAVLWDDNMHVTRLELRTLHGLWRIWFDLGATQQYYPLLHSAFWLEHRLWGDTVLYYHLMNVVLHATVAWLAMKIARYLAIPGAWLAGLLFALHPVCVEAVAWISEQKSTLSAVFCLSAALLYLHFDRSRRRSHYLLALGLFVMALMSKTVTATLPATLLVLFWWQRGRLDWKRDVLPLLPWFAIAIPAGLLTAWVEKAPQFIGASGTEYALSLPQRILVAGRVPWFYAWKLLVPVDLMFIYPHWNVDPREWWQYLFPLALAALAGGLLFLARKNRAPLAAFLIFVGTLFPVLGFLSVYPFRYSYVADHFQYLASLAILIPLASLLTRAASSIAGDTPGAMAIPAAVLAVLGFLTFQQSGNYRDYETLFRATLLHNPNSPFLHNNLGVELMRQQKIPDAVAQFREAVRLKPDAADFHDNLGLGLSMLSGPQVAIPEYRTSLLLDPHFAQAHGNLGLALAGLPGHLDEAIAEYQQAIADYKHTLLNELNFWEAHLNLGTAYSQIPGRQADAQAEYQLALQDHPDSALGHFLLGNLYHTTGRLQDAIAEYRTSLQYNPDSMETHYELAYALAQIPGRVPEAIVECQEALRINPNDGPARQLMASLQAFHNGSQ